MRCPVCQQAISEQAPQCAHCGFHIAQADRLFGNAPPLEPALNDFAKLLDDKERDKVVAQVERLENRFPQLRFSVVTTRLQKGTPYTGYMFWLFNRGRLVSHEQIGDQCRLILLGLDADLGRAFCMVGYGLEPFVPESTVQEFAQATLPALGEGNYLKAISTALETMETRLTAIAESLPKIYGIQDHENVLDWWSDAFAERWHTGQIQV